MLAAILSFIQQLRAGLTDARMALLDKLAALVGVLPSASDYTAPYAAKLDNLNAAISTLAPASTAVSTADLTSPRILAIDNLDVPLSGALATIIKSVQYGVSYISSGAGSTTATITSVNTSKSICRIIGQVAGGSSVNSLQHSIQFNSATQLSFSRGSSMGDSAISWVVEEYY